MSNPEGNPNVAQPEAPNQPPQENQEAPPPLTPEQEIERKNSELEKKREEIERMQREAEEKTMQLEQKNQELLQQINEMENKQKMLRTDIRNLENQKKQYEQDIAIFHVIHEKIIKCYSEDNDQEQKLKSLFDIKNRLNEYTEQEEKENQSDEENINNNDNDNNSISDMNDEEKLEYFNNLVNSENDNKYDISIQDYLNLTSKIEINNDEQFQFVLDLFNNKGDDESKKLLFTNLKFISPGQLKKLQYLKDFDMDYLSKSAKQEIFIRNIKYAEQFQKLGELFFIIELFFGDKQYENIPNEHKKKFRQFKRNYYMIQFSFNGEIVIHVKTSLIEDHLFFNQILSKITIPSSVTHIMNNAFDQCHQLTTVCLNCVDLERLGKNAFANCENLVDIELPPKLKKIEEYTFYKCEKLVVLKFPPGLEEIESKAFDRCESLKEVILPPTINKIGKAAFKRCSALETVIIPDVLEMYEKEPVIVVEEEEAPEQPAEQPPQQPEQPPQQPPPEQSPPPPEQSQQPQQQPAEQPKKKEFIISERCFNLCKKIGFILIKDTKNITIGKRAFESCEGIRIVNFHLSENKIDENAFNGCLLLNTVNFFTNEGCSLELGNSTFKGCSSLVNIVFDNPESIIEGHMKICNSVFEDCTSITEIKIPPNCDGNLGNNLFGGCTNLAKISLPNTISNIPNSMFKNLTNLKEINIPNSENIKDIGECAFENCTNFKSFLLPSNLENVGSKAFLNCKELIIDSLPESIKEIGENAFEHCEKITQLVIPKSLVTIKREAFMGCSELVEIKNHNPSITIENRAFYNCPKLRAFYSNSQENISSNAFKQNDPDFDIFPFDDEVVETADQNANQ